MITTRASVNERERRNGFLHCVRVLLPLIPRSGVIASPLVPENRVRIRPSLMLVLPSSLLPQPTTGCFAFPHHSSAAPCASRLRFPVNRGSGRTRCNLAGVVFRELRNGISSGQASSPGSSDKHECRLRPIDPPESSFELWRIAGHRFVLFDTRRGFPSTNFHEGGGL